MLPAATAAVFVLLVFCSQWCSVESRNERLFLLQYGSNGDSMMHVLKISLLLNVLDRSWLQHGCLVDSLGLDLV